MRELGGVVVAVVAVVCVTILAATGHDAAALIAFVSILPTLGLLPSLSKVIKQTNGQLDAARAGSHKTGYAAGYLDALHGRRPKYDEVSGIRVSDLAGDPPQQPPAAGGRRPRQV